MQFIKHVVGVLCCAILWGLFMALCLIGGTMWAVVHAQTVPANAPAYLPMLVAEQRAIWPDAPGPHGWTAAQVHKESCIHAKHPKCWNPRAELKTAREYGFGFGQITVAYRADGSERFNVFNELRRSDPRLKSWAWEDRHNPQMQLRALLIKNKIGYQTITGARNDVEHLAFSLAGYNGGLGGVVADRRLCQGTRGCDPSRWYGHVERTSNKSRVKWQGYGASAFDINRAYPVSIMKLQPLYAPYFKELQ